MERERIRRAMRWVYCEPKFRIGTKSGFTAFESIAMYALLGAGLVVVVHWLWQAKVGFLRFEVVWFLAGSSNGINYFRRIRTGSSSVVAEVLRIKTIEGGLKHI